MEDLNDNPPARAELAKLWVLVPVFAIMALPNRLANWAMDNLTAGRLMVVTIKITLLWISVIVYFLYSIMR